MKPEPSNDAIRAEAARWLIRRDRGLSSAESIEYELWLAADERHAAATRRSTGVWSLLDRIPETAAAPVLAAATRRRSFWRRTVLATSLAAAAAVVFGIIVWQRTPAPVAQLVSAPLTAIARPRTVTLSDGSLVQLNTGSEVLELFSAGERRILLARGEAHFTVTKNPRRPFVVSAGTLQVRAVGTAFNVNLQPSGIDVLVTEGRVQLAATPVAATATGTSTFLDAGERAVLRVTPGPMPDLVRAVVVSRVDSAEMARVLSWREPLLRLGGATLAELSEEFARSTGRRLVLVDPSLAELRFGGRFRADDIEGFTHLMVTTLDLDVERLADGTILLRKKKTN